MILVEIFILIDFFQWAPSGPRTGPRLGLDRASNGPCSTCQRQYIVKVTHDSAQYEHAPHGTYHTLHITHYTITIYIAHYTLYVTHTHYTPHATPCALPTDSTLLITRYTMHTTRYTLHTLRTLHTTRCTLPPRHTLHIVQSMPHNTQYK